MFVPIEKVARHFTVSVSTIRAWVRQGKARSAEEFDDRQLELDFDADEDI